MKYNNNNENVDKNDNEVRDDDEQVNNSKTFQSWLNAL